mmetsp:Transcript_12601/g.47101  ORF Transcript_12601/g.47101 Transcript_12601/m.47101 type:complete len:86 (+) Transcript_12601:3023-3280(+)
MLPWPPDVGGLLTRATTARLPALAGPATRTAPEGFGTAALGLASAALGATRRAARAAAPNVVGAMLIVALALILFRKTRDGRRRV